MGIFEIIGAIGLVFVVIGVLHRDQRKEDLWYMVGGIALVVYSIYIGNIIFIALQVIFIAAALYEFIKLSVKS